MAGDPRFARLCGRARIPSNRTVGNWLQQFTQASLGALMRLNRELLYEQIQQLPFVSMKSETAGGGLIEEQS